MSKNPRMVVITGGNRGIGEALTRVFFNEGDYVLIGARTDTNLSGKLGERVRFQKTNVCVEIEHEKLVRSALEWAGNLDVFINCAGISEWRSISEVDEKFWDKIINTNLKGTFFGCKIASGNMTKGGSIINISSLAGKRGSTNNSVYCASKFGINGITQSLAKELGPKGVRVNSVCPVYVRTNGLLKSLKLKDAPSYGKDVDNYLRDFADSFSALGSLPSGDEVAQACLFLASSKASAITGQCINIDCGVLPQ